MSTGRSLVTCDLCGGPMRQMACDECSSCDTCHPKDAAKTHCVFGGCPHDPKAKVYTDDE